MSREKWVWYALGLFLLAGVVLACGGKQPASGPPTSSAPAATAQVAEPASTATPQATSTPAPIFPAGGSAFAGEFPGGTLSFTIDASGRFVVGLEATLAGPIPCSDGIPLEKIQTSYGFSESIDAGAFRYELSGPNTVVFQGTFLSPTQAGGTLEMIIKPGAAATTCKVEPVKWIASAGEVVAALPSPSAGQAEAPIPSAAPPAATATPAAALVPAPPATAVPPAATAAPAAAPVSTLPAPLQPFACASPRVHQFDTGGGFPTGSASWARWGVISGEYSFAMTQAQSWGWQSGGEMEADGSFEVDVRRAAEGPGAYGLAFGGDPAGKSQELYVFAIDSNGYYGLFRVTKAGEWVAVQPYVQTSLLYLGDKTNHLRVVRSGPLIALYANGVPLATTFFDSSYTGRRYVGLLTTSGDSPGLEARYDNFTVCPLSGPAYLPVNPLINRSVRWRAGQPAALFWAWEATDASLARSFAEQAQTELLLDGQRYSGLQQYWSAPQPYQSGQLVQWNLPLPPLAVGTHRAEISISLPKGLSDGFDGNGDGAADTYGPGQIFQGWVEIEVEQ